jgi:uncharacterized membrane protein YdjX (TVP38/TMEM64 family)
MGNPGIVADSRSEGASIRSRRHMLALLLLALAILLVGILFHRYLDLETIRAHRVELLAFVAEHWLLAAAGYVAGYALLVLLSLPGASVLTITGGFLFGLLPGALAASVAATLGALAVFLVARSAFGVWVKRRAGPWLGRIEASFERDAFSYILMLRLVPVFPFFIINLVTPFLGVPLRTYAAATYLGVLPACFVYASFGAGLDAIFARPGPIAFDAVLTPEIFGGLTGLGLLALLPVLYKSWRRRRAGLEPRGED